MHCIIKSAGITRLCTLLSPNVQVNFGQNALSAKTNPLHHVNIGSFSLLFILQCWLVVMLEFLRSVCCYKYLLTKLIIFLLVLSTTYVYSAKWTRAELRVWSKEKSTLMEQIGLYYYLLKFYFTILVFFTWLQALLF